MPNLEKAKLFEITAGDSPTIVDEGVDVQFNPESLSLQLSNKIEGGRSSGRQVRQFVGSSSNVFTLDLEFDSADEGTAQGEPISVLEKTSVLDKFIQPKTEGNNASEQPAKLRFHWGNLIIDGIVETIDLELDHFAHNGFPLHAKASLKLKEQKIELQYAERGGGDAAVGNPEQVAQALDDELPSQAASRLGLNPANWRDLGFDLNLGLSLEAGMELNFKAGFSASFGVNIKAGVNADIDLNLAASLGLEAGTSISAPHMANDPRPKQDVSAGLALAKAGGIVAATNQVDTQRAEVASSASIAAFGLDNIAAGLVTTSSSNANVSPVSSRSSGTNVRPTATIARFAGCNNALNLPPDTRATTFGYSVPLQNRRVPILDQQSAMRASVKTLELTAPASAGRSASDFTQTRRRPRNRCGCQHTYKH